MKSINWDRVYSELAKHNQFLRSVPDRLRCYDELVQAGSPTNLPFATDEPLSTLAHLLVHSGMRPDGFQFSFGHVSPPQHAPQASAGAPMVRVELPFPPAQHRLRGTPTYGFFAHNTSIHAALNILREGIIRPSNFGLQDMTWVPSPAFYCRGSVHDLHGALRQACRFGGWNSARPICIFGRVPLAYLDVTEDAVRRADEGAASHGFQRHAAWHLKSK